MGAPIRVLVYHPCRFMGDALRLLLGGRQQLVPLDCCDDPAEMLRRVEEKSVDVVLLQAPADGEPLVRAIKKHRPEQLIVVLGIEGQVEEIVRLIEAGAAGYLHKGAAPDEVAQAVEAVYEGQPCFPPRIVAAVFGRVWQLSQGGGRTATAVDRLSTREQEILKLIRLGSSNKEIAHALDIELCTVKNHVHRILDKLQVHSRRDAARYAVANGLVPVV
jgi:two-component system NarL family response regulator